MGCTVSISQTMKEFDHPRILKRNDFIYGIKIGEGGFAKVVSAAHLETKEWVAIKEIKISNALQV